MPDPVTTNISLAVPVRGTDVGTWNTPVNGDMIIIDACAGSVTTKSLSNVNVTLSSTESQVAILRFSGVLTGNVIITLGAIIKSWICENTTTGAFTVTVKGSPGTGNVVGLPPGSSQIYWDGVNVSFINLERIGAYWDYAGATVPAWVTSCTVPPFLICDGTTFNSVTYPLLFGILGTTTLPDARGRNRIALDGGTGRVTTAGSGIDGSTRYASGGAQNVTMARSDMPNANVTVTITDPTHTHQFLAGVTTLSGVAGGGFGNAANLPTTSTTAAAPTGISAAFNMNGNVTQTAQINMPPAFVGGITLIRAA